MAYTQAQAKKSKSPAPEHIVLSESSFLQSATYDSVNFTLTLEFKNGKETMHRFVYPMVWQQFKEHPQKGSFYAREIKGKYPGVSFQDILKVSDLKRAIKENRPNAPNFNQARPRQKTY